MQETDWEKKDRRIGWMNCNTNAAAQIMAMATAGVFKGKEESFIRHQFELYRTIDYASFLDLDNGGGASQLPEEKNLGEPVFSSSSHTHSTLFETVSGSPPSPKKKGKGKGESGWFCSTEGCGQPVSEKVYLYSNDKFGRTLCFDCQDKEKERIEKATCAKDLLK